jgi:hypothetical protein
MFFVYYFVDPSIFGSVLFAYIRGCIVRIVTHPLSLEQLASMLQGTVRCCAEGAHFMPLSLRVVTVVAADGSQ